MISQLKQFISSCQVSQSFQRKNLKESLMNHSIPDRPWSKIAADHFEFKGEHYLILVGYYSDWIEFDKMRDQTAAETIALLLKQFSRWGHPDEIVTDGGKNFDSKEFSQFCSRKQIKHTKFSPHHDQSNGKAESAVKIVKSILRKTENSALNPCEALLNQHNTPTVDMTTSPAQRFLQQRLKSEIPLLTPEIAETVLKEKAEKTAKPQMYYNQTAKDLSVLKPGDTVTIKPEGPTKGQKWRKGLLFRTIHFVHTMLKWMANSSEETVYTSSPQENHRIWRRHNLPKIQKLMLKSVPQKVKSLVQILYLVLQNLHLCPLSLLSPLRRWN